MKKTFLLLLITLLLYFSYLGISKHKAVKFTASIEIKQPLEKTIALWQNPENYKHWQEGFISKELLSGTAGEVGAVSEEPHQGRGGTRQGLAHRSLPTPLGRATRGGG